MNGVFNTALLHAHENFRFKTSCEAILCKYMTKSYCDIGQLYNLLGQLNVAKGCYTRIFVKI